MVYERMCSEKRQIEQSILALQEQLKHFPDGKLFCSKNGKYLKWYLTDGKNQQYLPKKDRELAEKMALKKYLSLQMDDLIHERQAIEFYLRHHKKEDSQAETLFFTDGYQELLAPHLKPISKELQEWAAQAYDSNPKYKEQLIFKTPSGHKVRSKSEVLIALYLYTHKIPFRYEAPLTISEIMLYPDFTIRHPQTGNYFYWEHFGMIDDPAYCKKMHSKLQLYTASGIYPGIQLITTYETKEVPLNPEMVEKVIEYYFE